ncbi:hypothetical protein WICPIJ_000640 [Wickerhamomyces pijperi]|uniref:Uncharacterized protein n=1 Tax=Wickerhamomyces pijperi TaxID=599730 RepID=A0A9P8QD42_WICPI|nr:hypothetical protein WICPIJ_000640 [Wickerhamomyces pijperi]
MSNPPKCTLVLSNIPRTFTLGIDLQFFNSNDLLKGIKLIPKGLHVFHYQPDQNSIRTGFYFEAKENEVIICYWDAKEEKLLVGGDEVGELNITKEMTKLPEYYSFMIVYPEQESSLTKWQSLVSHLSSSQLQYVLPRGNSIDSTLTSTQENNLLLQTLHQSAELRTMAPSKDPILNSVIDQSDLELKYTPIEMKDSIRPNSTPQEKTIDGLDKSWYLGHLLKTQYNTSQHTILGETQLCYLNFIIFANHSSLQQWLKLQHIISNCSEIIISQMPMYQSFLHLMILQYENLPQEYFQEFIEVKFIKKSIAELELNCKEQNLHSLVKLIWNWKDVLREKFYVNFDKSSRFGNDILDDYDLSDEFDEDGPVVVEEF